MTNVVSPNDPGHFRSEEKQDIEDIMLQNLD